MSIFKPFVVVFTSFALASVSSAGMVTMTMQNGDGGAGPFNTVLFNVANNSAPGVNLEGLSITVGDTQYLFDQLYLTHEAFPGGDGSQAALLTTGDRSDDNAGPDFFAYSFTNLGPGVAFRGQWDIDNDNGDFNADARLVMFNNGAAPNAVATFHFSDGSSIDFTFPDGPSLDFYTFAVPSPGTLALGVIGAGLLRRRR